MNSVFEEALLSLLFYTQIHSFIALDFFLQNFYPYTLSFLFMEGHWAPITCSLVLVQLRKAHLDITEKLLTGNLRNYYKRNSLKDKMVVKTCQDLELKLSYSCRSINKSTIHDYETKYCIWTI